MAKVTVKNSVTENKNKCIEFEFDGSGGSFMDKEEVQSIKSCIPEEFHGDIFRIAAGRGFKIQFTSPEDAEFFKAGLYRNDIINPRQAGQIDRKIKGLVANKNLR
ncbi:MAG: hypothetical protein R3D71_09270 [Rickettsiales bacterium]